MSEWTADIAVTGNFPRRSESRGQSTLYVLKAGQHTHPQTDRRTERERERERERETNLAGLIGARGLESLSLQLPCSRTLCWLTQKKKKELIWKPFSPQRQPLHNKSGLNI